MKRAVARELMDDPLDSLDELCANLREIETINRLTGTTADIIRIVIKECGARSVLDVGSGLGEIGGALAAAEPSLHITCLDRSEQMLALARERAGDHPRMTFVQGDARALPFSKDAFDVAMCNLSLHHFEPADAVRVLAELRRVARRVIVTDLCRSAFGYIGARVAIGILSRNRLTRHDGPLSVRRAYTPQEACALAREAGWAAPHARKRPFFRMILQDG